MVPFSCLELLSPKHANGHIREIVVDCVAQALVVSFGLSFQGPPQLFAGEAKN